MLHRHRNAHHPKCTCDPDTLDAEMKAELCQMVHERDPETMAALLDDFMDAYQVQIRRLLSSVAHQAHLPYREKGDLLGYLGEALMFLLTNQWRKAPAQFDTMTAVSHILNMRTRELLRKERLHGLSSSGGHQQPGSPGHRRKMELVDKSRERYVREQERTPTYEQLAAYHNALMHAQRSDPRKQGVLVTVAELRPQEIISIDDEDSRVQEIGVRDSYDESAVERMGLIEEVFDRCEELDEEDRERQEASGRKLKRRPIRRVDVARQFFMMHRVSDFPTKQEISKAMGATEKSEAAAVSKRLGEVMTIAQDVFAHMRSSSQSSERPPR